MSLPSQSRRSSRPAAAIAETDALFGTAPAPAARPETAMGHRPVEPDRGEIDGMLPAAALPGATGRIADLQSRVRGVSLGLSPGGANDDDADFGRAA